MNQRELTAALEAMTKERNKLLAQVEADGGSAAVAQVERDAKRSLESAKAENDVLLKRIEVLQRDNERLEAEVSRLEIRVQEQAQQLVKLEGVKQDKKAEPEKTKPAPSEPLVGSKKKDSPGLTEPFSGQIPNDPDAPVADHAKDDAKDESGDSPLV